MNNQIDRIMEYGKFLKSYSIDPTLYYVMKTNKRNGAYSLSPLNIQIMFHQKENKWDWRVVEEIRIESSISTIEQQLYKRRIEQWQSAAFGDLIDIMINHNIDMTDFENRLKQTIYQNVTFANRIVKETEKMMGEQVVMKAIKEEDRFAESLSKMIRQVLSLPPKTENKEHDNVISLWGKPKNNIDD